jgi:Rieske Fe-S protein
MNSKQVAIIVLIIVIFSVGAYTFGWTMGANFDPSSTYTAPARVAEVDETTGWVTFVDWAGEAWCIRGEGYEVDQLVVITFNDNNTESIYDDLIVNVGCLVDIEEVK